jgi:hypothetical protein
MNDSFQKLRLKERKPHEKKCFAQALFGGFSPWYLPADEVVAMPVGEEPVKVAEERTQVLEKLEEFAITSLEGSTEEEMLFPGGSIKLKGADRTRVVHLSGEINPLPLPHNLNGSKPLFLCLGETDEPAQAQLLTKMLGAMKLDSFSIWRIKEPAIDQGEEAWLGEITSTLWHHRPVFILSVGALVTNILLGEKERLSRIHGQFFEIQVKKQDEPVLPITMVPIFHPEFLLINPKMKHSTWTDLQSVMSHLGLNTP